MEKSVSLGKKVLRIFPRQTKATPDDAFTRIGCNPGLFDNQGMVDEIHISVSFSWDIPKAEILEKRWKHIAPVKLGGPALGTRGGEFIPGFYVKPGYVITSRGCPNKCWFCSVWKRDGTIRELPIREGWNVLDDNLLACSENHIRAVFSMLKKQPQKALFTGGIEAKRLKTWHVDLLTDLKPLRFFCAYDTPDDYEPLVVAGRLFKKAGFSKTTACCYVLCGFPKDTESQADKRLRRVWEAGFYPYAMIWRDKTGVRQQNWIRFNSAWSQPACVARMLKDSTRPFEFSKEQKDRNGLKQGTLHIGETNEKSN